MQGDRKRKNKTIITIFRELGKYIATVKQKLDAILKEKLL